MNQCVPSRDLKHSFCARSKSSNSFATDMPSLDYEVAELTWENGEVAMYGLGPPRVLSKPAAAAAAPPTAWDKPRASDTLESIVDQATSSLPHVKSAANNANNLVPWLDRDRGRGLVGSAASAAANMDALVPCNNSLGIDDAQENSTHVPPGIGAGTVGSCSAATGDGGGRGACLGRAGRGCCKSYASASQSGTCGGGLTSATLWSPENSSSGEDYTKSSGDDRDFVYHNRSQRQAGDRGNRKLGILKSSISAKNRAAANHNQSERRRRDKINQRMKTLQKLVPNSSKTDKASMLDEVIDYLKQLQAQVLMMSRMMHPSMMMPMPMQQHLQMSMMAGMGMGMGMGVMDINALGRAAAGMAPPAAAPFVPMPSWDNIHAAPPLAPDLLSNFFACQQLQPMTIDGYSRLAALYQQFQQSSAGSGSKK